MTIIQMIYVVGAPPALVMPLYYHFTNRWWTSKEGRMFMLMMLLPFGLYLSTVLFLFIEANELRDIIRTALVSLVAIGTWTTAIVYWRLRRDELGSRRKRVKKNPRA